MRRFKIGVLFLGLSGFWGAAGCSGEPVPPTVTTSPPGHESIALSDDTPRTAVAEVVESDRPSPPARETADAAVETVFHGLRHGQPDAVWDALPASYQADLNNLVRMSADRLNPAAWRWFLQIVGKAATVVRSHRETITVEAASTKEGGQAQRRARALDALVTLLERISSGGPDLLEQIKTVGLGEMLRTDGRALTPLFSALMEFPNDELQTLRLILQASVTLKDSTPDSAVLAFGPPESDGAEIEFVRVEGKWIPRWLADRWADVIGDANAAICEALPSETPSDNFGRIFQALAYVDFALDASLWAAMHPGVDPDSMFGGFPSALTSLLMYVKLMGYLIDEGHTKTAEDVPTVPETSSRVDDSGLKPQ